MDYAIKYHNVGKKPADKYVVEKFSIANKLFNVIVPWMLNDNKQSLFISSLALAEKIGLASKEFVNEYKALKLLGKSARRSRGLEEYYQEILREKRRLDRCIQKGLHVLEHKLGLISRTQVFNEVNHGSRRFISLNIKEIRKIISCFDMSIREFELCGVKLNMTEHRGMMIVIRKMIKNRIFSLYQVVKDKMQQFNEFVKKQARLPKIQNIVMVKQFSNEVVQLIEEEITKHPLKGEKLDKVLAWHYSIDDVREAVLIAVQQKKLKVEYVESILINKSIRKSHEEFVEMERTYDLSVFDRFND